MKTAILGGGLSGLTLARLLQERGEEVVILEAERDFGGLCRSKKQNGFTFDTGGSHIIFSRDAEVLAFMHRMIAENVQHNNRNTKIFYKGRYVKYPFENGLSDLPPEDRFFCINEFIRMLIAVEKGDVLPPANFREWITYTFGNGIAACYMIPYNEKIWNFPTEKMSMHWVDGRIPRPPVEDVIRSAIGIETEGYTHQSIFSYPLDGGIQALVHAIARPVEKGIKSGFVVTSLQKRGNGWEISNGTEVVHADRCICTMPVQHLLSCLENVPENVKEAARALKYNSLVCVNIGIEGEVPAISWLYLPETTLGPANRISFPSNYSRHVAPDRCSAVLAEITCMPGDEVSRMSDEELTGQIITTLEQMQLVERSRIVLTSVERQPYAYVVYDLDYQKNIAVVKEYCASAGIPLVGRFAQFEYLNMDGCIRNAINFVASYPRG